MSTPAPPEKIKHATYAHHVYTYRDSVQFPTKVAYFEGAEDVPGEREKGVLRLKNGQMAVVYKTDDPHWWLGKVRACVRSSVGWLVRRSDDRSVTACVMPSIK